MQRSATGGRVTALANLSSPRGCSSLRRPHSASAEFRQHALHRQRDTGARCVVAFSVSATIAARPRIDAPPTATAGRADDGLLDCVVVGGGISGLVTAQVLVHHSHRALGEHHGAATISVASQLCHDDVIMHICQDTVAACLMLGWQLRTTSLVPLFWMPCAVAAAASRPHYCCIS